MYIEPGYSANDIEDGIITGDVVVTFFMNDNGTLVSVPSIDTSIAAQYTVRYEVADSNGNMAMEERIVNVLPILNAEPSADAFLFTDNVIMNMLMIPSGTPVDQIYNVNDFELSYTDTGEVIATGTNSFDFNARDLEEKEYTFTVDKGLPSEQIVMFKIIHYPIDRVYYGKLGSSGIDYRVIAVTAYKNDEAIGDSSIEIADWGVTTQLMIEVKDLIEEGGNLKIYENGTLIQTISDVKNNSQHTILGTDGENITVEYDLIRYGHVQSTEEPIDCSPSKNVLNRVNYGLLGSSGVNNYQVVQQTLGSLDLDDTVSYGKLGSNGIDNFLRVNQTSSELTIDDQTHYGALGSSSIQNYLVIQQSNTEVN